MISPFLVTLRATTCRFFGATALALVLSAAAHAQFSTGFETPFTTGTINGQQGWVISGNSLPVSTAFSISTSNPASGTQSLRLTDNTDVTDLTLSGAFSPLFSFAGGITTRASADFYISDFGGANYSFIVQAPSQALITAQVQFDFLGSIFVLDDIRCRS